MSVLQKSSRKASSRTQIDLRGVKDSVLLLPGNRFRMIIQVSSVNFELMSELEQDAIIDTYEGFLNSVSWPLQVLVRTREIDLDKYLGELGERLDTEQDEIFHIQLSDYREFINSLVTTNKILTRHFYVIVPFQGTTKLEFENMREQLNLRVDIVIKGLARLGVQSRVLSSLEVLDLFYGFYNPTQSKLQPLITHALELLYSDFIRKGLANE